jgi:hypothetical protein
MPSFRDQLPTDNLNLQQYGPLHDIAGYGEMYMWPEVIVIDGISFEVTWTAHSDMWSGFGDRMDPRTHLGPRFAINCRDNESELDQNDIKAKRLRRVRRKRGMRHFGLHNLGTPMNPSPTTLNEAFEAFERVIRDFLSGRLGD